MCVANVGNVSERAREEMELIERMCVMACVLGFVNFCECASFWL